MGQDGGGSYRPRRAGFQELPARNRPQTLRSPATHLQQHRAPTPGSRGSLVSCPERTPIEAWDQRASPLPKLWPPQRCSWVGEGSGALLLASSCPPPRQPLAFQGLQRENPPRGADTALSWLSEAADTNLAGSQLQLRAADRPACPLPRAHPPNSLQTSQPCVEGGTQPTQQ